LFHDGEASESNLIGNEGTYVFLIFISKRNPSKDRKNLLQPMPVGKKQLIWK